MDLFTSNHVTLGYMMVPGVDFTERFSPVATDEALELQIAVIFFNKKNGWTMEKCDIEAAFLESDVSSLNHIQLWLPVDSLQRMREKEWQSSW